MKNIGLAIFTFLSILNRNTIYCQVTYKGQLSFVESTASVQLIDSEYLLIPKLIVKSKDEKIKIHQPMYYTPGDSYPSANGRFYLQKKLTNVYENISLDML